MAPAPPETILVCDDEHSVRNFVCTLLTRHGYQVLEAQNGKHALDVAEAHDGTIHLLLSDVMMPTLNGPGLAEHLRAVRPDVRVIFMSAFSNDSLESLDGCPFIEKPFRPSALLKTIGDSLAEPPKPLRGRA
jgi:two-component system cell cycle sensor histidine kinase/response regulator CckA